MAGCSSLHFTKYQLSAAKSKSEKVETFSNYMQILVNWEVKVRHAEGVWSFRVIHADAGDVDAGRLWHLGAGWRPEERLQHGHMDTTCGTQLFLPQPLINALKHTTHRFSNFHSIYCLTATLLHKHRKHRLIINNIINYVAGFQWLSLLQNSKICVQIVKLLVKRNKLSHKHIFSQLYKVCVRWHVIFLHYGDSFHKCVNT